LAPPAYGCYAIGVAARHRKKSRLRRIFRAALAVVALVVLIPVALVPLYRLVPPVSTLMVASWLSGDGAARVWVGLDDIAPIAVASVLVSEDGRFCAHNGVDWEELNKVIAEEDETPRGASTIAMQTVRNLFLWTARSYLRKAVEIPLALYGDLVWGKRRTMEIYLNVAQWGPGLFGIEAAARRYFSVPARALDAHQAALLAAALPNPAGRNPARPSPLLARLAARVEERARTAGPYVGCLEAPARL
jgi:monofunctional biosynthetic peptidoglycan transglycosylase